MNPYTNKNTTHFKAKMSLLKFHGFVFAVMGSLFLAAVPVLAIVDDTELEEIIQNEINKHDDVQELNTEIESKADEIRTLSERQHAYEENIQKKQEEKLTLENQVAVLEDKIGQTETQIDQAEIELDVTQDEIEKIQEQIRIAEDEIEQGKTQLADLIMEMYTNDRKTPVEVTFTSPTFSHFYSELEYTSRIQNGIQDIVNSVQKKKIQLTEKRTELKDTLAKVSEQKTSLELAQVELEGQQEYKNQLITETEEKEENFQALLDKVQTERSSMEGEIASLQKSAQTKIAEIRAQIEQRIQSSDGTEEEAVSVADQEFANGVVNFIWPVSSRTVTCGFHCGGYPFAGWIGQHSGMDISTGMGSSVTAAASGYVTRAVSDGTSNLAWVMITHGNGLATVYMHLSDVNVSVDQYVTRGTEIGKSGGMPGTPGAGAYSTGPHLHFEIRVDGIPTNPASYLP